MESLEGWQDSSECDGGVAGGVGKVRKVEEVMSFSNFLLSSWDFAHREMEAGGGEGLRNESKVVTRQLGLQAWVLVKWEKYFSFFLSNNCSY